jgi:hypothetical protein
VLSVQKEERPRLEKTRFHRVRRCDLGRPGAAATADAGAGRSPICTRGMTTVELDPRGLLLPRLADRALAGGPRRREVHARTAILFETLSTVRPSNVAIEAMRTLWPAMRFVSLSVSRVAPLIGTQPVVVQSCH